MLIKINKYPNTLLDGWIIVRQTCCSTVFTNITFKRRHSSRVESNYSCLHFLHYLCYSILLLHTVHFSVSKCFSLTADFISSLLRLRFDTLNITPSYVSGSFFFRPLNNTPPLSCSTAEVNKDWVITWVRVSMFSLGARQTEMRKIAAQSVPRSG